MADEEKLIRVLYLHYIQVLNCMNFHTPKVYERLCGADMRKNNKCFPHLPYLSKNISNFFFPTKIILVLILSVKYNRCWSNSIKQLCIRKQILLVIVMIIQLLPKNMSLDWSGVQFLSKFANSKDLIVASYWFWRCLRILIDIFLKINLFFFVTDVHFPDMDWIYSFRN